MTEAEQEKRMEQQKEGIRQEFMLLNWYLKEHLASAVRIAAFIGVFSLLCFLRNVPQDCHRLYDRADGCCRSH